MGIRDSLLLIDVGNTRIKWRQLALNDPKAPFIDAGNAETQALASVLARWRQPPTPLQAHGCCVADPAIAALISRAMTETGVPTHWLTARAEQCGVRNAYQRPAQLGADRWASLIAVHHSGATPAIVVNAGTAVTVDALDERGNFLGGIIIPGLTLMRSALSQGTAQLTAEKGQYSCFPTQTADAIQSGCIQAVVGAVRQMRGFLQAPKKIDVHCVISGGDASALSPHLPVDVKYADCLVLDGLAVIALAKRLYFD